MPTHTMFDKETLKAAKLIVGCDTIAELAYGDDCIIANSCPVPWRLDGHWSGGFFAGKTGEMLFHDFSEEQTYDAVKFAKKVFALETGPAIQLVLKLARIKQAYSAEELAKVFRTMGLRPLSCGCRTGFANRSSPQFANDLTPQGQEPANFLDKIAEQRGFRTTDGLLLLYNRGMLRHLIKEGFHCWCLTDTEFRNANARRLDGEKFECAGTPKAKSLWSSEAQWPVGVASASGARRTLLVEGGPDLLTAATVLVEHLPRSTDEWQLVASMGVAKIHAHAIPLMTGRHVVLAPQLDVASTQAAARWTEQLEPVAASVRLFRLSDDVHPGKDLNDAYRSNPELLTNLFNTSSHEQL